MLARRIGATVVSIAALAAGAKLSQRAETSTPIVVDKTDLTLIEPIEEQVKIAVKKYNNDKVLIKKNKEAITEEVCSKMLEKNKRDCQFLMDEFFDSLIEGVPLKLAPETVTKSKIENILKKE